MYSNDILKQQFIVIHELQAYIKDTSYKNVVLTIICGKLNYSVERNNQSFFREN
ncbi:MAG: hypothetical protein ACJA13_000906 [Paraglaciecola sp.]|jgi:hypothetical protein